MFPSGESHDARDGEEKNEEVEKLTNDRMKDVPARARDSRSRR